MSFSPKIDCDKDQDMASSLLTRAGHTNDAVDLAVLRGFEEVQEEGAPDLIVQLIDLYLDDAPLRLAAMLAAFAKADELSLKRAAHSLRGSSSNLGARQLAVFCGELEQIDCNCSFPKVEPLLRRIEPEFARVRQAFLAERQRRGK